MDKPHIRYCRDGAFWSARFKDEPWVSGKTGYGKTPSAAVEDLGKKLHWNYLVQHFLATLDLAIDKELEQRKQPKTKPTISLGHVALPAPVEFFHRRGSISGTPRELESRLVDSRSFGEKMTDIFRRLRYKRNR